MQQKRLRVTPANSLHGRSASDPPDLTPCYLILLFAPQGMFFAFAATPGRIRTPRKTGLPEWNANAHAPTTPRNSWEVFYTVELLHR